jgi:hypothetical protein
VSLGEWVKPWLSQALTRGARPVYIRENVHKGKVIKEKEKRKERRFTEKTAL